MTRRTRKAAAQAAEQLPPPAPGEAGALDAIALRVAAGLPVTRAEAEALTRRVARACKGPVKPGKQAEYAELRRQLGGPAVPGGDIALLDSLNREGCGADFNDLLCRFPFDGQEHQEPCHKCGQLISFRSPFFVLEG